MPHSIAIALPWGLESIGYFSKLSARRLLVFVHGFGGSATGTWQGMDNVLTADPSAQNTDIVFFGYSSLRAQPENSAGLLRGFLDDAAGHQRRWKGLLREACPGETARAYDEVLIVAHSLGAPVARRAILDGLKTKAPWASKARLVLFAPAHKGAFLIRLQKQLAGTVGSVVATLLAFAKVRVLSLDALEPGSPFLETLLKDSEREFQKGSEDPIRARQVIFGYNDDVVMTGTFLEDPPADVWDNHGHSSVCRAPETSQTVIGHLD
jgi:pimeloyl-ACP methyl ester carboxylesterase